MPKRISHILLALLVMISTMGMTVSKHFCGDELIEVTILTTPDSCCDSPTGCCHNETTSLKVKDEFSVASFTFDFSQWGLQLPPLPQIEQLQQTMPTTVEMVTHTPPPPPRLQTVLSRLQSFLL